MTLFLKKYLFTPKHDLNNNNNNNKTADVPYSLYIQFQSHTHCFFFTMYTLYASTRGSSLTDHFILSFNKVEVLTKKMREEIIFNCYLRVYFIVEEKKKSRRRGIIILLFDHLKLREREFRKKFTTNKHLNSSHNDSFPDDVVLKRSPLSFFLKYKVFFFLLLLLCKKINKK